MTRISGAIRWAPVLLLMGISHVASAHHSYGMFDRTKEVQFPAVVRTWMWSNPHAMLWVYINDTDGKPQLWGVEAPGPSALLHNGWDKYTVKPGDKVTVTLNPLRDGRHGGNLVRLVLANGTTFRVTTTDAPIAKPATDQNKQP